MHLAAMEDTVDYKANVEFELDFSGDINQFDFNPPSNAQDFMNFLQF